MIDTTQEQKRVKDEGFGGPMDPLEAELYDIADAMCRDSDSQMQEDAKVVRKAARRIRTLSTLRRAIELLRDQLLEAGERDF